jgi:hypothetical protein
LAHLGIIGITIIKKEDGVNVFFRFFSSGGEKRKHRAGGAALLQKSP